MASYMEDLARWRLERRQAQIADRVNQIADEYREAVRERDRAIADGDTETASFRDDDAIQLEQEYLQYCPPQAPQMDPSAAEWVRRNKSFFDRHGPQADAAVRAAHAYVTRPRVPNETNPARTGCGLRPNTKAYWDALETALEVHGPDFYGVRYDPSEKALTANEVANFSGQSPEDYNRASRQLAADGRFTSQQGRK
jgi:hypothetical protein